MDSEITTSNLEDCKVNASVRLEHEVNKAIKIFQVVKGIPRKDDAINEIIKQALLIQTRN